MFKNDYELSAQNLRETSSTKQAKLGTLGETIDGRKYRYAKAGAVALIAGKMHAAAAQVGNHVNRTVAAAQAVGDTQIQLNLGATAATADQYADGYIVMNDSTGEGIAYRVKNHVASAGSAALVVNLDEGEPVQVALVASTSEGSLIANPWSGVVIAPSGTGVAQRAVGVANVAIPASNYGWLQTGGDCATLSDGVIGKGSGAILSDAVDGAVEVEVAGTVTQRVGFAPEATVDTEHRLVVLTID